MLKKVVMPHLKERTVSFVNPTTGDMITHNKTRTLLDVGANNVVPLDTLLSTCTSTRVFLVGKHTDTSREWFIAARNNGWITTNFMFANRSCTFSRDGKQVEIRHIESFFPGMCDDVEVAYKSYTCLQLLMQKYAHMPLLTSPSQTGLMLLEQTLPASIELPTLDADVEAILRDNIVQARNEVIQHPGTNYLDNFYYQDGRWMYAACCGNALPTGKGTFDNVATYEKYVPGWYHVTITVPDNWEHVGLIPLKQPSKKTYIWEWPNTPGYTFTSWVCEPELRLADEHGWKYIIHQRLMFEKKSPLRNWHDLLVEIREVASSIKDTTIQKYVMSGVRKIMLDSIGRLNSNRWKREQEVTVEEWVKLLPTMSVESRLASIRTDDGKHMLYPENVTPVTDKNKKYYHPHIALYIWSLCRMHVTRTMLTLPYEDIIGVNLDAIYLKAYHELPDKGIPGYFRLKGCIHHRVTAPTTEHALTILKQVAEENIKECETHV